MLVRQRFFLLAGLLPGALAGVPEAGGAKLAVWNTRNYTLSDGRTGGRFLRGWPKDEAEKSALRQVLAEHPAECWVLLETGGEPFLRELQRDLRRTGGPAFAFVAPGAAEDQTRQLGLLARTAPRDWRLHADLSFPYLDGPAPVRRGLLEATFGDGAAAWRVYAVHLKSRLTEDRRDRQSALRRAREAAAVAARIAARQAEPGAPARFVVAGDCNAGPEAEPLRLLLAGVPGLARLDPRDEAGQAWTYMFRARGQRSVIDHLLASPALRAVPGLRPSLAGGPAVERASDHRPMLLHWPGP